MSQAQTLNEGGVSVSEAPHLAHYRLCEACEVEIPQKRLEIMPNATMCVPCLEAAGDVPLTKRFDEATKDGIVETMFTHNAYVEQSLHRLNHEVAPDEAYMIAIGDDSHLTREILYPAEGHHLSEAFEEDEEETVSTPTTRSPEHKAKISAANKKRWAEWRERRANGDATPPPIIMQPPTTNEVQEVLKHIV